MYPPIYNFLVSVLFGLSYQNEHIICLPVHNHTLRQSLHRIQKSENYYLSSISLVIKKQNKIRHLEVVDIE